MKVKNTENVHRHSSKSNGMNMHSGSKILAPAPSIWLHWTSAVTSVIVTSWLMSLQDSQSVDLVNVEQRQCDCECLVVSARQIFLLTDPNWYLSFAKFAYI